MIKSPQKGYNFEGNGMEKQQLHSCPQPDLYVYCIYSTYQYNFIMDYIGKIDGYFLK